VQHRSPSPRAATQRQTGGVLFAVGGPIGDARSCSVGNDRRLAGEREREFHGRLHRLLASLDGDSHRPF